MFLVLHLTIEIDQDINKDDHKGIHMWRNSGFILSINITGAFLGQKTFKKGQQT